MSQPTPCYPITKGNCICFVREGKWVRATVLGVFGTTMQLDMPDGPLWFGAEQLIEAYAHVSEEPLPMHIKRSGVAW